MERSNQFLADRLQEVLLDGSWIAHTNFKAQIQTLDWRLAIQKVGDLNTISALIFHINYYLEGLLHAFQAGELTIRDQYSYDVLPIQAFSDWEALVNRFLHNAEKFIEMVREMEEDQLSGPFIAPQYGSCYRNILGKVEHSYYHLGQISLLRKMLDHQQASNLS